MRFFIYIKKLSPVLCVFLLTTILSCVNDTTLITSFDIPGHIDGLTVIDNDNNIVSVGMPHTTDLTSLTPTITISTGATIAPLSGVAQDFTNPVTYTVTDKNKMFSQKWTVTVYNASNEALIKTFNIPNSMPSLTVINNLEHTVSVGMPEGTDLSSLTPTITVSTGATIDLPSGTIHNLTAPVTYTVTAEDKATIQDWTVTVYSAKTTLSGDGISFVMIYVPGGLSYKTGADDLGPPATVDKAFWIAETELTYPLWYEVREWAESTEDPANPGHSLYTFFNGDLGYGSNNYVGMEGSSYSPQAFPTPGKQYPATWISWSVAMVWSNAFTEWFNAMNGTNYTCVYYTDPNYTTPSRTVEFGDPIEYDPYVKADATGFRMLSNAEWELAARYKGSDSSYSAYEYPVSSGQWWTPGNYASGETTNYDEVAVYKAGLAATVKNKQPNTLGLYDMSGNVYEWIFDRDPKYATYPDPYDWRMNRGGSWLSGRPLINCNISDLQVGVVRGDHADANPCNIYGGWCTDTGFRFGRTAE